MLNEFPQNRRSFLQAAAGAVLLPLLPVSLLASERYQKNIAKAAKFVLPKEKWEREEMLDFLEAVPAPEMLTLKKGMKILGEKATTSDLKGPRQDAREIQKAAMWAESNIFVYPFRRTDFHYHDMVMWMAGKLSVPKKLILSESSFMLEREITKAFFAQLWDKLTEEQRRELLDKIDPDDKIKDKAAIAALGGAAALATLSATVAFSGFAFYTTMSVAISTIAGFFGITLPFAAYTGASSLVAFLTGPVGWAVMGLLAVGGVALAGRANQQKTAGFLIQMHMLKVAALLADGVKETEIFPKEE
jgi:uncharacterized protein YaaW (UPF0174 family)